MKPWKTYTLIALWILVYYAQHAEIEHLTNRVRAMEEAMGRGPYSRYQDMRIK